jgi:hypothetical protein
MPVLFNLTSRYAAAVLGALLFVSVAVVVIEKHSIHGKLRKLTTEPKKHKAFQFDRDISIVSNDPALSTLLTAPSAPHRGKSMPFKLTQQAADWCMPPAFPELDYYHCDPNKPVNRVLLFGGL